MKLDFRTASLAALMLLSAAAADPATSPASAPSGAAIDWSEAAKHVDETVTVTGPVKGIHMAKKNVVLNVGKDYPAKDRFTVMVPFTGDEAAAKEQFVDKTVTVTGKVKLYKEIPEIVAKKASEVTVQK